MNVFKQKPANSNLLASTWAGNPVGGGANDHPF
jgi:hypothetical protein